MDIWRNAKTTSFEYQGFGFYPVYNRYNGDIKYFSSQLSNMDIRVFPHTVYLCNSLHKFYAGNNHGDFARTNINESIQMISEQMHMDWGKAALKRIEYGCNVACDDTDWMFFK